MPISTEIENYISRLSRLYRLAAPNFNPFDHFSMIVTHPISTDAIKLYGRMLFSGPLLLEAASRIVFD